MKKFTTTILSGLAGVMAMMSVNGASAQDATAPDPAVMAAGQPLYATNCQGCHGAEGEGGIGERLAGSPIVALVGGIINQILVGSVEHGMPPFDRLSNEEIAAISTYVRNSFGNAFSPITPDQVQQARGAGGE